MRPPHAVNHYECLKVTQDAPPEVIRAAYRAMANRLHPDRNGGVGGPDDASHDQMASLNAAYEVLIDPMLRREYDARLEPMRVTDARPLHEGGAGASGLGGAAAPAMSDNPMDRPWQGGQFAPPKSSGSRQILSGIGLGLALLVLAGFGYWRMEMENDPLERSVANEVVRQPGISQPDMTPSGEPTAVAAGEARRPTVEELSRMSDEELVNVLPALDGKPAASGKHAAAHVSGPHILDGSPIQLRVETHLVDPLAPASDPTKPGAVKVSSRQP